jgi:hypothetical protein
VLFFSQRQTAAALEKLDANSGEYRIAILGCKRFPVTWSPLRGLPRRIDPRNSILEEMNAHRRAN